MEKLEHPLWIVDLFNAILGPPVRAIGEALGYHFTGHHVIPNYVVMVLLIVLGLTVLCLVVRSRLSVENPGKLPLHLIEVQSGSYLGEDDIVRFEDIYQRA